MRQSGVAVSLRRAFFFALYHRSCLTVRAKSTGGYKGFRRAFARNVLTISHQRCITDGWTDDSSTRGSGWGSIPTFPSTHACAFDHVRAAHPGVPWKVSNSTLSLVKTKRCSRYVSPPPDKPTVRYANHCMYGTIMYVLACLLAHASFAA